MCYTLGGGKCTLPRLPYRDSSSTRQLPVLDMSDASSPRQPSTPGHDHASNTSPPSSISISGSILLAPVTRVQSRGDSALDSLPGLDGLPVPFLFARVPEETGEGVPMGTSEGTPGHGGHIENGIHDDQEAGSIASQQSSTAPVSDNTSAPPTIIGHTPPPTAPSSVHSFGSFSISSLDTDASLSSLSTEDDGVRANTSTGNDHHDASGDISEQGANDADVTRGGMGCGDGEVEHGATGNSGVAHSKSEQGDGSVEDGSPEADAEVDQHAEDEQGVRVDQDAGEEEDGGSRAGPSGIEGLYYAGPEDEFGAESTVDAHERALARVVSAFSKSSP
ncbi:unnamed protein product [Peniophora sp. CBMAI 1063]|nr:unnamed protein product [Peniophora sp. CBMAI 1063]